MTMRIATLSRHEASEVPDVLLPVLDEVEALMEASERLTGEELPRGEAEAVMAKARTGGTARYEVDCGDPAFPFKMVVRLSASELVVGQAGEGTLLDEDESVWISLEEYVPNEARKAELDGMTREDLVERLLLLEATTGRDSAFPR